MKRRLFLFGLGSMLLSKSFVRENETFYIGKPIKNVDYDFVSIKNCEIKKYPWFDNEEPMILIDTNVENYEIVNNHVYAA